MVNFDELAGCVFAQSGGSSVEKEAFDARVRQRGCNALTVLVGAEVWSTDISLRKLRQQLFGVFLRRS